ncbi:9618_t:CDS:2, partial [Gigaspora margarita]
FEKALEIFPENVAALFYSGKIYFELEQYDRVLSYSSEALKIYPDS